MKFEGRYGYRAARILGSFNRGPCQLWALSRPFSCTGWYCQDLLLLIAASCYVCASALCTFVDAEDIAFIFLTQCSDLCGRSPSFLGHAPLICSDSSSSLPSGRNFNCRSSIYSPILRSFADPPATRASEKCHFTISYHLQVVHLLPLGRSVDGYAQGCIQ